MSNGLDPDLDQHSVGPDLGLNCLQWLSADDKSPLAREDLYTRKPILGPSPLRLILSSVYASSQDCGKTTFAYARSSEPSLLTYAESRAKPILIFFF